MHPGGMQADRLIDLNDPTRNIYHSIDGIKIVKSEDGKLCGVGRMPRHLRT